MSFNVGYGSLIEDYQRASEDVGLNPPVLDSISLTKEEAQERCDLMERQQAYHQPHYWLADVSANNSAVAVVKDSTFKLYHVMSVKQSLREDLAEQSYQLSCRAADWSKMSFGQVPMQFEPLKLHVVDALGLGQQDVPDYFQQPAKAITEDVSVKRGPQAEEWIQAVEETILFKKLGLLGVYEEMPQESATSTPLPARLTLVTKPNGLEDPSERKQRL